MQRKRVLFVCTHNSARSQMAEGLLRAVASGRFEAYSAGTEATDVRPEAIAVMNELGIDISGQASKTIDAFRNEPLDVLITVCDDAREACPVLPGVRTSEHWSIDDPSAVDGSEEQRLAAFRRARDTLRTRIESFLER